jgi:hypothetical protein
MVNRTGTTGGAVSVSYATTSGTALVGTDYSATGGSLNWAAGDATAKAVTVTVNPNGFTGTKSFGLSLSNPTGAATLGTPSAIVIADGTNSPGLIALSAAFYNVNGATATITVNRVDGSNGAVSVDYATVDGTAIAGTDYVAKSGVLSWASGDSSPQTIVVAVDTAVFTGNRIFNINLSNPTGGATLRAPQVATVTPATSAFVGALALSASNYASFGTLTTIKVERVNGSSGAVTVGYATSNGSGVAGTDYTAASGTLSWDSGDASPRTIVVLTNPAAFTGNDTFKIALINPTGGATLGAPSAATITTAGTAVLADAGALSLSSSAYTAGGATATVVVDRIGGFGGSVTVKYATSNGTAVAGTDYTAASGQLSWNAGDASARTLVIPVDTASFTGAQTFHITLSDPTGGATLGATPAATITTAGTGKSPIPPVLTPGVLGLSASAYNSSGTSATVTVGRSSGSSGDVTVGYDTVNGSAISGTDYTAASGTLSWSDGDTSSRTVVVTVNPATFIDGKSFHIGLSDPTGGATLGTISGAAVTAPAAVASNGTLGFSAASYSVARSAGSLTVSVARSGGGTGTASVSYATANGTAVAGTDYTSTSGTLNWAGGDTSAKTFVIPVASGGSGGKAFTVGLSDAGGASLGTPASANVSISSSTGSSTMSVRVQGTHLIDASGTTLQLRGVNVSGLESVAIQGWDPSDPWGGWGPVWSALQAWHINVVRLPLNPASWLGTSCVDSNGGATVNPDPGNNYKQTLETTVSQANAAGMYVILDLQWTAPGDYCPLGQNQMADTDHDLAFWTSIANQFKNNPAVIFQLFNEPFLDRTSGSNDWDYWLNGGPQTQIETPINTAYNWTNAGEQQMLNTIRATGATNVIMIGGLSYSNDLSGWPSHPPKDPLNQVAASFHVYSFNSNTSTTAGSYTVNMLSAVAATVPLIIDEIGDNDTPGSTGSFVKSIMEFADANGYSYLAWAWNSWGQSANDLITDSAGDPTPGFGVYVKQHYICKATTTGYCE